MAIDELGEVVSSGAARPWDGRAATREQAVLEVLAGAISEADADLAKRGDPPAQPPPMDRATARFYSDVEGE